MAEVRVAVLVRVAVGLLVAVGVSEKVGVSVGSGVSVGVGVSVARGPKSCPCPHAEINILMIIRKATTCCFFIIHLS